MPLFGPPPPPPSALGRYRLLSPTAGVRVSPFCLGAMSLGEEDTLWVKEGMGQMSKQSSFELLDAFFDMGGNFIDTANNYQDETSEMIVGEWAEKRGVRDQLVIATKYTTNYKYYDKSIPHQINYTGNGTKSLHLSVEASLKKLRTSYIDILYVHWWDFETTVEEVMNSLHNLVVAGKVLYLGISDTPAWIVSKANTYARLTGKTPFVIYQGRWNVMERSFERDIIPMCRAEGLALAPWNVIGGGRLRTDAEEARREASNEKGRLAFGPEWKRTPDEVKMSRALEEVAKELGVGDNITAVAIAYLLHKTPYVFPIVGGRKVSHLQSNVKALEIALSDEQIKELESVIPFDVGFPNNFVGDGSEPCFLMAAVANVDRVRRVQAIRPGGVGL